MKIRMGFVSNSSSSSFVAVITKDAFDETLNKAHPFVQAVIKAMIKKESVLDGMNVVTMSTYNDAGGGSPFEYLELDYDGDKPKGEYNDEMSGYEAFDQFLNDIPKNRIVTHSTDW